MSGLDSTAKERLVDDVRRAWQHLARPAGALSPSPAPLSRPHPISLRPVPLECVLNTLTTAEQTDPAQLAALLRPGSGGTGDAALDILGPADLAYLFREAGVDAISSPAFVLTRAGRPLAAAGYEHWPNDIAHLCVLTHPQHAAPAWRARWPP